ncbi:MAG TPA: hypothetical protein VG708_09360 [Mycobacteriales bacterium]|nr:hypothetical protein [Mycobacteriales bacterium]
MRRRLIAAALAVAASVGVVAAIPAQGAADRNPILTVDGGSLLNLCYQDIGTTINTPTYAACRGLQALANAASATCRLPLRALPTDPAITEDCAILDGREVSEAKIERFQHSWLHHALALQNRLDRRVPLYEAQIPATHNSFNASSYVLPAKSSSPYYLPSLTNLDPNQVYSLTDQLRMGIRGLEVDLHWVPSIYGNLLTTGGFWVDVCHGQSTAVPGLPFNVHIGCTVDRSLQNTLLELRRWVARHPHQFLLIYLENQLDGNLQAHNITARLIRQTFGHWVYRPPSSLLPGECASMPYGTSEHHILATGARVMFVGNCGPGAWNREVFTRGPLWNESGNPTTYGAADCAADEKAREAHDVFRRWYQESPFLEALMEATQTMTPAATRRMVRCGVNLTGWDQLLPGDGRLNAFVWSWARGEPAVGGGRCAYQDRRGRFRTSACDVRRPAACVDRDFDWHVTKAVGPAWRGAALCRREFPHARFGVPPNGYRNAQLRAARNASGPRVWLDYGEVHGRWRSDVVPSSLR